MDTNIRDAICDMGYEDSIVFDNPSYDKAIIGVTDCGKIVYNYNTMIECLMENENMTGKRQLILFRIILLDQLTI